MALNQLNVNSGDYVLIFSNIEESEYENFIDKFVKNMKSRYIHDSKYKDVYYLYNDKNVVLVTCEINDMYYNIKTEIANYNNTMVYAFDNSKYIRFFRITDDLKDTIYVLFKNGIIEKKDKENNIVLSNKKYDTLICKLSKFINIIKSYKRELYSVVLYCDVCKCLHNEKLFELLNDNKNYSFDLFKDVSCIKPKINNEKSENENNITDKTITDKIIDLLINKNKTLKKDVIVKNEFNSFSNENKFESLQNNNSEDEIFIETNNSDEEQTIKKSKKKSKKNKKTKNKKQKFEINKSDSSSDYESDKSYILEFKNDKNSTNSDFDFNSDNKDNDDIEISNIILKNDKDSDDDSDDDSDKDSDNNSEDSKDSDILNMILKKDTDENKDINEKSDIILKKDTDENKDINEKSDIILKKDTDENKDINEKSDIILKKDTEKESDKIIDNNKKNKPKLKLISSTNIYNNKESDNVYHLSRFINKNKISIIQKDNSIDDDDYNEDILLDDDYDI